MASPTFVSGYKTDDGQFFTDREDAVLHQKELEFDQYYSTSEENHCRLHIAGLLVTADNIIDWLKNMPFEQLDIFYDLVDGTHNYARKI